ncbi:hypothetical protein F8388_021608 [Cannabis sativa]|uniref:Mediator of RNA polymerase II transcription subunit 6 n=1 Tax=Cannabis sativa TaxID=3483 RepID=A0A7J6G641_CANSA|nr:hypothetical protein F8388_021608 [Cannabis sativa]
MPLADWNRSRKNFSCAEAEAGAATTSSEVLPLAGPAWPSGLLLSSLVLLCRCFFFFDLSLSSVLLGARGCLFLLGNMNLSGSGNLKLVLGFFNSGQYKYLEQNFLRLTPTCWVKIELIMTVICLDHRKMIDIEFMLSEVMKPHLFVFHKQKRDGPEKLTLLTYYVLDGSIYQAPQLCNVFAARVVGTTLSHVTSNPTTFNMCVEEGTSFKVKKGAEALHAQRTNRIISQGDGTNIC